MAAVDVTVFANCHSAHYFCHLHEYSAHPRYKKTVDNIKKLQKTPTVSNCVVNLPNKVVISG